MGLRPEDLKDLVHKVFEIDSYKSKMGDDRDIITLSFSVKEKAAADDLVNFIEKGYDSVLDADATAGEQSDGTYKVFVELERNRHAPDNIMEIAYGLKNACGLDDIRYRYHKKFKSIPLSQESLEETVPLDQDSYDVAITESSINNYKDFFSKSFLEDISLLEHRLTVSKKYAQPLEFNVVDFGETNNILNNLEESLDINGFSEVIFLSKYVGDYNITKYGRKITFENKGHTLVLERL